jgi:hypothetical protein
MTQQERTEITEAEKEISVFSVASCSNAFCSAGSKPMKEQIQQEQTEVTETEMEITVFSVASCSNDLRVAW